MRECILSGGARGASPRSQLSLWLQNPPYGYKKRTPSDYHLIPPQNLILFISVHFNTFRREFRVFTVFALQSGSQICDLYYYLKNHLLLGHSFSSKSDTILLLVVVGAFRSCDFSRSCKVVHDFGIVVQNVTAN